MTDRRDLPLVAVAALAASIVGIANDFVYDDLPLIAENVRVHSLGNLGEIVSRPYWPPPFVEQLYRPLATVLIALQYVVGDGAPVVFRLLSYALYAACAVAFFRLARELVSRNAALAAALLFAVHPVHVEAVALGVNQGELIVGLCALVMTRRYIRGRREGGVRAPDWIVIVACYAAAVLTKEHGYVLPALLVVAELLIVGARPPGARVAALWRGYAALAVVAIGALWVRSLVLAGVVGASPAAALKGLNLGERAVTMLQVIPMWLRLLVWPQHLRADYRPDEIVLPSAIGLAEVAGIVLIVAAVMFIVAARRKLPVAAFGLAWCVVALLPVSNLIPTGIVLAERTLFTPSVGFLVAVAALGEAIARRPSFQSGARRNLLVGAAAILVGLGLAKSANRQSLWNSRHVVVRSPSQP